MATATERVPVLLTPEEKQVLIERAQAAQMSMGEFLRRAAASFRPSEDEELLAGMIGQLEKTTAQANAALDDAFAFIEASEQRIAAMEAVKVSRAWE